MTPTPHLHEPETVRPPAVAGTFYPADPNELAGEIDEMLRAAAADLPATVPPPVALIAPHAGYVYSGPVAASAYARLARSGQRFRRVVVIGPAHRVGFEGVVVSTARAFATPLGEVAQDRPALDRLLALPQVSAHDAAHAREHSLEVHLPFLQKVLGEFQMVALVVGQASADEVAAVLAPFLDDPESLIVASTDLSHYHDYATAQAMDRATADAIAALDEGAIRDEGACGRLPVRGLLKLAKERGLRADLVDLRNSGDTACPRDRVVGYASFVLWRETAQDELDAGDRERLLSVAEQSVRHGLDYGAAVGVDTSLYSARLQDTGASFITVTRAGRLRGCIGSLAAHRPLVADVAANAYASAFTDPRFPALQASEWPELAISVSVLSPAVAFPVTDEADLLARLKPGIDGLILHEDKRRATFLPQVWDQLPSPPDFLSHLKRKAGLAEDHWSDRLRFFRYTTQSFGRPLPPLTAP